MDQAQQMEKFAHTMRRTLQIALEFLLRKEHNKTTIRTTCKEKTFPWKYFTSGTSALQGNVFVIIPTVRDTT